MIIKVTTDCWNQIDRVLRKSFEEDEHILEWGLIGIVHKVSSDVFIIEEVIQPGIGEIDQEAGGICFNSRYIRKAMLRGKERRATGLIFFHTHPLSDGFVDFSSYDDEQEPSLIENIKELWELSEHVSIVCGKNSIRGRIYREDGSIEPVIKINVIGKIIKILKCDGKVIPSAQTNGVFDRASIMTGAGALSILKDLRIAIVGAGGTGSLMIELLQRTGCKNLTIIDHDKVEDSNLNRLLHSSFRDVKENNKKIEVVARAHELAGFNNNLELIDGNVQDSSIQEILKNKDFIIGCVDNDTARYILNGLAMKYCLPYIDLGTEIGVGGDGLSSLDARVTYIYPGGPCLLCRGLISMERIRLEGLQSTERARHVQMGYCRDINISQPAVMELNMRAASLASLIIRHLFQPFLDVTLEMDYRESLINLSHRQLKPAANKKADCFVCGY